MAKIQSQKTHRVYNPVGFLHGYDPKKTHLPKP